MSRRGTDAPIVWHLMHLFQEVFDAFLWGTFISLFAIERKTGRVIIYHNLLVLFRNPVITDVVKPFM